jgi:hypothetical protein
MLVSDMKTITYPLAVASDLLEEVRRTAKATGLSMADVMRQSIWLGLPRFRQQLGTNDLRPFTAEEVKAAFKPDRQWEAFESAMTSAPISLPEE